MVLARVLIRFGLIVRKMTMCIEWMVEVPSTTYFVCRTSAWVVVFI